jgi:hypothetical protein
MVAAFVFWVGLLVIAFATQASFFSMEEYLNQPMWTADVPWPLDVLLGATAMVIGLSRLALFVVCIFGLLLLSTRIRPHALYKASWLVLVIITINVFAYELLALVGYAIARHRLPNGYIHTFTGAGPALAILGGLAFLVWYSGRRMVRVAAA